jgi:hypothetical protein
MFDDIAKAAGELYPRQEQVDHLLALVRVRVRDRVRTPTLTLASSPSSTTSSN